MSRVRTPAIRLDPAAVRETRFAYWSHGERSPVPGVREVELTDGRVMYRCIDCLLAWSSPGPPRRHRDIDVPHVAGGQVTPITEDASPLDVYMSTSVEVVPADTSPAHPVPAPAPRRGRHADPEVFLDANARDIKASMVDFLDVLIDSRTAARERADAADRRAEQSRRTEQDMRQVLRQMRTMIEHVLGPDEQDKA